MFHESFAPKLPAEWEPVPEPSQDPDKRQIQDGRHGAAYAAKVQLVVCEYPVSVGKDAGYSCGPYTNVGPLGVYHLRYHYEVRDARSATVVGTFDLDSDAYRTPVNLFCPDRIPATTSKDDVVAEVVSAEDLANALRPYVEPGH